MGRCYEFGVAVAEGCEHAMVVTPEGGACQCRGCGVRCEGRFPGCAAIVAIPNRVPPAARTLVASAAAVAAELSPHAAGTNGHGRNGTTTVAEQRAAPALPKGAAADGEQQSEVVVEQRLRAELQKIREAQHLLHARLNQLEHQLAKRVVEPEQTAAA